MNKQVFRDLSEMTSMKTKVYMYIHPCNHICTYILGCVKIREVPTIHVCMCIYVYVCVHIYTYTHIRGSLGKEIALLGRFANSHTRQLCCLPEWFPASKDQHSPIRSAGTAQLANNA